MSFTVVVMARSVTVTMRFSISFGVSPVYDQTTLITGILMLGKMSFGVVMTAAMPRIAISTDTTTNVYGRRSAKRTIHIVHAFREESFPLMISDGRTVCAALALCG